MKNLARCEDCRSAGLSTVLHLYSDRLLPFDSPTAEIAGALSDLARPKATTARTTQHFRQLVVKGYLTKHGGGSSTWYALF